MAHKILIIDDELEFLSLLESRLKKSGYKVVTATNGKDGLSKVRAEQPDMILLDIVMPQMGGYEFYKEIKRWPRDSQTPILILTGRGAMKDTFEAIGADAFMEKPIGLQELLGKIELLLKDKALILSRDDYITDRLKNTLEKNGFKSFAAKTEEGLQKEAKLNKYKLIVAHIPFTSKKPGDFVNMIKALGYKDLKIIVYRDEFAKESRWNNMLTINKWAVAGAAFYDEKIANEPFEEFLSNWLS